MDAVTIPRSTLRELAKWAYMYVNYEVGSLNALDHFIDGLSPEAADAVREVAQRDAERQSRLDDLTATDEDFDVYML